MALVWQYGEKFGNASWKGLSWGMFCAFCYEMLRITINWASEGTSKGKVEVSLSLHPVDAGITSVSKMKLGSFAVLVALQAALTVLSNATMCIAAFCTYRSQEQ
ncbi:hypothetical protein RND71_042811 [Anisodus tanguticus]|uniref:Uncharacterized protein n=1 Tax=Anisodus tanguticus TaxID=243964 RepID=A0AAE1QQY1_9SOLA|nr:hypothetical protein RND71_042811 [Anisodus tanguticus]